jgi:hypothetical protein
MLTAWLARRREARRAKLESDWLIKRDGFICYCRECRATLNNVGVFLDEDRCQFKCQCGMVSIFEFGAPVPILLSCLPDDQFPPKDVAPILP